MTQNIPSTSPVKCAVCGRPGAKWELRVDGKPPLRAHKPCGELTKQTAPQGVTVSVRPSPELREEWARQDALKFWQNQKNGGQNLGEALRAAGVEVQKPNGRGTSGAG